MNDSLTLNSPVQEALAGKLKTCEGEALDYQAIGSATAAAAGPLQVNLQPYGSTLKGVIRVFLEDPAGVVTTVEDVVRLGGRRRVISQTGAPAPAGPYLRDAPGRLGMGPVEAVVSGDSVTVNVTGAGTVTAWAVPSELSELLILSPG